MARAARRGLQFCYRSPDPHPHELPVTIAAVEHQIGMPGRFDLGVGTVLPDRQVRGPPDIKI